MTTIVAVFGAIAFGCLVAVCGLWYGRTWLTRHWVALRLRQILPSSANKSTASKAKLAKSSTLHLDQLAEIMDTTARHLRLGESLTGSLRFAITTNHCSVPLLTNLARECAQGEAISDVCKRLAKTATSNDLLFVLRTFELAATGGVGGILALERTAIVLRERATHIHDRYSQAAQALLSTRVLSWTPVVVALWLIITSSAVRNYLILTQSGWICVLLGVGFNLAGRKWMEKIISPSAS
ncbi:MAG: hypothetical protein HQ486_04230 [Acidimicrobiaceae bacterium]|nr:hypothetical protein [Acidimicrobiaceae bacterium]